MAAVSIAFGNISDASRKGDPLPMLDADSLVYEANITPSGASQQSAAAPGSAGGQRIICRIATDTTIYAAFGSNPTAAAGSGMLILANIPEYVAMKPGDKVAVINGP